VELNHLEIQFLVLQDFNLMISPAEMQFYADHLLGFWIMEQQRQAEKSFMGIIPPQPPLNLEFKSPVTPMTPGTFFTPNTPSTTSTYVPSTSSSTSTAKVYPPYQTQYSPMDGIQQSHTSYSPRHREPPKENQ